jgi:transcriptional regulator with XRE-family HTH domain
MMKDFKPAKRHVEVSIAESSGIPQSTISAIENGRIRLGVERAKTLARALQCHPAVLLFPGWDVAVESAA